MELEQKEARRSIELFKSKHRLGSYRVCSEEDFRQHAETAHRAFCEMYPDDNHRVVKEMEELARFIEAIDFDDPVGDGHHARAAQAIRELTESEVDLPWVDHVVELEEQPQLHMLASALWEENPAGARQWNARFTRVFPEVWSDQEPTLQTQVRPAASRLSTWMNERDIGFNVSVNAGAEQFECEILDSI